MACLVNGEYIPMSSWKDNAYDGAGDCGTESRAFCSIAAILGSIASSRFTTCSNRPCMAWIDSVEERETGI